MADGSYDLAIAIHTALTTDSTVTGFVGSRVYDVPPNNPANSAFPYITLMDQSIAEWGADDFSGSEHTLDIQCWSRPQTPNTKEVRQLCDAVRTVLHNSSLSVSGQAVVNFRFESSLVLRDQDGQTFAGVLTFRVVTCAI